jgi:hypothetical protein
MSITEYLSEIGRKGGQAAAVSSKVDTTKRARKGARARWAGHKKLSRTAKNAKRRIRWAARKAQHQTSPGGSAGGGERSNQ